MAEILGLIWEIIKDYWLIIVVAVAAVGVYINKKVKGRKSKVKMKKMAKKMQKPLPDIPPKPEFEEVPDTVPPLNIPPSKDAHPFSRFGAQSLRPKEQPTDVVEGIRNLTGMMQENSADIDRNMMVEFEKMRKQLQDIHAKKQQIKDYGLELSNLFDKYNEREVYLTSMMAGMEEIINRTGAKNVKAKMVQQRPQQPSQPLRYPKHYGQ